MNVTVKICIKEIDYLESVVSKIYETSKKHPNVIKETTIEVQESEITSGMYKLDVGDKELSEEKGSMSTKADYMDEPATQRQLTEWSLMSSSSIRRVRVKANIALYIAGINSIAILAMIVAYFIK